MNAPFHPATVDPDEAHEIAREEALEEFREWQGRDYRNREFEDFGDWLARMSQPHMVGCEKYALAMNYAERTSDERLSFLSRGQRKFDRESRGTGGRCPSGPGAREPSPTVSAADAASPPIAGDR